MTGLEVTHVGYSDESNWNKGRFRSLGLVTCRLADLPALENEFRLFLQDTNVSEIQWKKLNNPDKRDAAKKILGFVVDKAYSASLRVDVLIWDIEDSRHNIKSRDDNANLQRMYYHLFRNMMSARWSKEAVWRLRPDRHTSIDWMTMQNCLDSIAVSVKVSQLNQKEFQLQLQRDFNIEEIQPVSSTEHPPLLQLADLFAGMAVFSRKKFQEYREWCLISQGQSRLFPTNGNTTNVSRKDRERFKVLKYFDSLCKSRKMGVSLKTKEGLWTPTPNKPLNFWLYKPQHSLDKAPISG